MKQIITKILNANCPNPTLGWCGKEYKYTKIYDVNWWVWYFMSELNAGHVYRILKHRNAPWILNFWTFNSNLVFLFFQILATFLFLDVPLVRLNKQCYVTKEFMLFSLLLEGVMFRKSSKVSRVRNVNPSYYLIFWKYKLPKFIGTECDFLIM